MPDPATGAAPPLAAPKVATAVPLPIVPVTIIGTMSDTIPTTGTVATTPGAQQPNLLVHVITPVVAILIRFANVYLLTLIGLLGTSITGAIAAPDFLHLVLKCGAMSLAPAGLALGKDLITVLSGLEQKFPLATGAI